MGHLEYRNVEKLFNKNMVIGVKVDLKYSNSV